MIKSPSRKINFDNYVESHYSVYVKDCIPSLHVASDATYF